MTKLTVQREPKKKRASAKPDSVKVKMLTASDGTKTRVLSVDANSPTFGDDFLYVFKRNVREARAENKRRLGSPSGAKRGG